MSLLSRKLFLAHYKPAQLFSVAPEKLTRNKLLDLYFFTTTYTAWAGYAFKIITSKNPWEDFQSLAEFVTSHNGPMVSLKLLEAALESSPLRSVLTLWIEKPQLTKDDLKDGDDCWECCYEDPECRSEYNGNEIDCFEKCTKKKISV